MSESTNTVFDLRGLQSIEIINNNGKDGCVCSIKITTKDGGTTRICDIPSIHFESGDFGEVFSTTRRVSSGHSRNFSETTAELRLNITGSLLATAGKDGTAEYAIIREVID